MELNGFGKRPGAPDNILQSGNNSQTLLPQEKNKMTTDLNRYLKIQRKLNIIKLVFSAEQLY